MQIINQIIDAVQLFKYNRKIRKENNSPFWRMVDKNIMPEKKLCPNCHCNTLEGDKHLVMEDGYVTCRITLYVGEKANKVIICRPVGDDNARYVNN